MSKEGAARFLNRVGGFAAGVLGAKTGIYSQVENFSETSMRKIVKNAALHNSAAAAIPTGAVYLGSKMVKEAGEGHGWMGYKLSGLGQAALVGAVGYSSVKDIAQSEGQKQMGQVNTKIQQPVSMMADYDGISQQSFTAADTGADGDLVFALNKLR